MVCTRHAKLRNTRSVNGLVRIAGSCDRLLFAKMEIASNSSQHSLLLNIMAKSDIHPKWYPEAKVYCNGEMVMTVGSTKPELHVDIWSGNHPFFTGTQKIIDTEGRVERFLRKYGMTDSSQSGAAQPAANKPSEDQKQK
jgi:large subunit ribosomal protein L31